MADGNGDRRTATTQRRRIDTFERLLVIQSMELTGALATATEVILEALGADTVVAFLYEPATETLVATGARNTPMAHRQRQIGLDRVPLANGGRTVEVFQTGVSYHTGHADQDPVNPCGLTQGLAARSLIDVPLEVGRARRGVVEVVSAQTGRFTLEDHQFVAMAVRWVGVVAHRAELASQSTSASAERSQYSVEDLATVLVPAVQEALIALQAQLTLLRTRARQEGRPDDLQTVTDADLALRRLQLVLTDAMDTGVTPDPDARPAVPDRAPEQPVPSEVAAEKGQRILMVDGAPDLGTGTRDVLEARGYLVLHAADGAHALAKLRTALPDLVVLQRRLPDMDGLSALREIRAVSSAPVIMVNGSGTEDDTVLALRQGADDYLARPSKARDLLARIERSLRRSLHIPGMSPEVLAVDADLTIDFGRNRVILRGKEAPLTAHEHRLLYHLVTNAGRLMHSETLLLRVWGPEYRNDQTFVRLYVSYLRAKIEPNPRQPRYILTEKGLGYRFTELAAQPQSPERGSTG